MEFHANGKEIFTWSFGNQEGLYKCLYSSKKRKIVSFHSLIKSRSHSNLREMWDKRGEKNSVRKGKKTLPVILYWIEHVKSHAFLRSGIHYSQTEQTKVRGLMENLYLENKNWLRNNSISHATRLWERNKSRQFSLNLFLWLRCGGKETIFLMILFLSNSLTPSITLVRWYIQNPFDGMIRKERIESSEGKKWERRRGTIWPREKINLGRREIMRIRGRINA